MPSDRPPACVPVPYGHLLRPLRLTDEARYRTAVEGSHRVLRDLHGTARGWPPVTWGRGPGRLDLLDRLGEMERGDAWTYALLDADETALLGCVRVAPGPGGRPVAWWWIVEECLGTDLAAAVDALVPRWLQDAWSPASFR
jgi:hypothetical protein